MKTWLLAAVLWAAFLMPAFGETMEPREAAELLNKSVVEYTRRGDGHCTAFKIGYRMYMTAGHCIVPGKSKVTTPQGFGYQFVAAITFGVHDKITNDKPKDWAILHTYQDDAEIPALRLACNEELYVGQKIAYMGYPNPLERFFGMGHIASFEDNRSRKNNSDIAVDLQAAPGASGSPVISMDTGNVIGILTEGYIMRFGAFAIGLEGVNAETCAHAAGGPDLYLESGDPGDAVYGSH